MAKKEVYMFTPRVMLAALAFSLLSISLGAGSLSIGELPVSAAASLIEGQRLGSEIIISSLDNEKFNPAIAYNSNHDEYLVVWQNNWPSRDIYAWRMSSRGELLSWFTVASGATDRAQPSVAYDPINDRYLVVFIHDVYGNGSDWDVGGRYIPWNGPEPGLPEFPICNWSSSQWNPVVTYARTEQDFTVVWANTPTGLPAYISGVRLAADGSGPRGNFTISGPENRINPDIAYNLARNEYLVVWEHVGGSNDIHAARMTGSLSQLGSDLTIAGWPDNEEHPTVAACHITDGYLVAWQSLVNPPTNYDVYARHVSGDALLGSPFIVDGTTAPEIEIDSTCNLSGREYLLAWQTMYAGGYYGIWGRLVDPGGMGDAFELAQPGAAADRLSPVAAGGRASDLAVWVHDRDGSVYQDLRGRLIFHLENYLPLVRR
jgi:hypothetical protein